MSTLKEITYRLWRKLEGGNIPDDTKYTYRELVGYIKSGVAEGLKQSYFEQRNLEDFKYGDDSVTATYKATVQYDPVKALNYVDRLTKTISIAGNRFTSVSSSSEVSRFSSIYVPIRKEQVLLKKLQPDIPCVISFYKEDGKLYFYAKEVKDKEVLISERYSIPNDDNADMSLPEEFENKVIRETYILITNPMMPSDKANDGTSTI